MVIARQEGGGESTFYARRHGCRPLPNGARASGSAYHDGCERRGFGTLVQREKSLMSPSASDDDPPPVPPVEPALEDCCGSGCNPCIFELYQDALERYREQLAVWQERQRKNRNSTRPSSKA
jgi:hypothetical protein